MIHLPEEQSRAIEQHGESSYPHECCGFLLGREDAGADRRIERCVPAGNVHDEDHARRYLISPHEQLQQEREARAAGLDIVGYYHSHPDVAARPSTYDRDHAWPWYTYMIVSVVQGRAVDLTAWRLADDRSEFVAEQMIPSPRFCGSEKG